MTGTLYKNLCTFMTITYSVLLKMRNISQNPCRKNQNIHFMFNNFIPNIVSFMR
jgi:hypothetical protein